MTERSEGHGSSEDQASSEGRLTPYGLTCELRSEPLGIDEPCPRLSWKLADARRGASQSAYRIRVATRAADLSDPTRLCWDSGLVPFDDTKGAPA